MHSFQGKAAGLLSQLTTHKEYGRENNSLEFYFHSHYTRL